LPASTLRGEQIELRVQFLQPLQQLAMA